MKSSKHVWLSLKTWQTIQETIYNMLGQGLTHKEYLLLLETELTSFQYFSIPGTIHLIQVKLNHVLIYVYYVGWKQKSY